MSSDRPTPALAQDEIVATSSTVVYRNPWMTVREDNTVRRNGATGIFGVVEKPDFALVIPYEQGGFHLVEQFRYPVKGRYWESRKAHGLSGPTPIRSNSRAVSWRRKQG